jgi:hypothetical protein
VTDPAPVAALPSLLLVAGATCCSVACRITMGSRLAESGCIEWQGAIGTHGYGVLKVPGAVALVHRLAYEIHKGPVPEGLYVMHRCDNPKCVTPEHLAAGTPSMNSRQMVAKGNHWKRRINRPASA